MGMYRCSLLGREGCVGELDSRPTVDTAPGSPTTRDSDDDVIVSQLPSSERVCAKLDVLFGNFDLRMEALTELFSESDIDSQAESIVSSVPSYYVAPPTQCFSDAYDAPDCPTFPRRTGLHSHKTPDVAKTPPPSGVPEPAWIFDASAAPSTGTTEPWPPMPAFFWQRQHRQARAHTPSAPPPRPRNNTRGRYATRSPPARDSHRPRYYDRSPRQHRRNRFPHRTAFPSRQHLSSPPRRCLVEVDFPQGHRQANFILNTSGT